MRNEIALTILEQLGGNRFVVMTGAKDFVADGPSLSFKLPGNPGFVRDGINYVTVSLEPDDTYTVRFQRLRAAKLTMKSECFNVYCDTLQSTFTRVTGLDTHL